MLSQFIDFVNSVLPSVDPDFRDGAKEAIRQFERNKGENQPMFTGTQLLKELSQGDILSGLPFIYFEEDGSKRSFRADGIVLSTSCHIDHHERLVIAPFFDLSEADNNKKDIENNTVFSYMYINEGTIAGEYADFNFLQSFSKSLVLEGIKRKKFKRIYSLSQIGYYFLIIKLSVYFMRKEDSDTLAERYNYEKYIDEIVKIN